MPRKNRAYKKETGHFRDATYKLIVGEGKTEAQYFTRILPYINEESRKRVKLRILPYQDNRSAIKSLIEKAINFREIFEDFTIGKDRIYILADKGIHEHHELVTHFEACEADSISLIISTPCFEIWLLFHVSDLNQTSFDIQPLQTNGKPNRKAEQNCEKELKGILVSYNKANIAIGDFLPHIDKAKERAAKRDNSMEKYPYGIGSKVYQIFDTIGIDKSKVLK